MELVDWAIVLILALAVMGGLAQGFLRSFFALGGLLLGLALAAWNYGLIAAALLPVVRIEAVANAVGALLIALFVMVLAGVVGGILAKAIHCMGLGCLDRIAGAVFGFFQGALLVTLFILVVVAFFPRAHWLAEARLPRLFFGACNLSTRMSPAELASRVQEQLKMLEEESPRWMHPEARKVI
jgi:membrane protein required for colicin V production